LVWYWWAGCEEGQGSNNQISRICETDYLTNAGLNLLFCITTGPYRTKKMGEH
jgi:hypothetical protein